MDAYERHRSRIEELEGRKAALEARRKELLEQRKDASFRLKTLDPLRRDAMRAAGLEPEPELAAWNPDADAAVVESTSRELDVIDQAVALLHDEVAREHEAYRQARIAELDAAIEKLLAEIAALEQPIRPIRERVRALREERDGWQNGLNLSRYMRLPGDRR